MRDLRHDDPLACLPPRMMEAVGEDKADRMFNDLPWMRRERADANIRRAIADLRKLAVEDTGFAPQYRAMADTFESALNLLNVIEDAS